MASTSGENDKELRLKYMLDEINRNTKITDIDDYYDFTNDKRGVALLFNNEFKDIKGLERGGSEKDCTELETVLKNLKFEVRVFKNLRLNQIRKILYDVSKVDHSNNDCLLVAVMTHGKDEGQIRSADHYYHTEELWKNFVGSNCESLVGKPKLFFIQACRGETIDIGVSLTERNTIEEDAVTKKGILIPNFADLMIMYSTSEGYKSLRNKTYGSWFIEYLCGELKSNSQDDLMRILMRVSRSVAFDCVGYTIGDSFRRKQMPSIVSMLTKLVYFSTFGQNFDPTSQVSSDSFEEKHDIDLR